MPDVRNNATASRIKPISTGKAWGSRAYEGRETEAIDQFVMDLVDNDVVHDV